MRSSVFLCLILFSFTLWANSHRQLPNGQYAYYGQQFYQAKSQVNRELLFQILNSKHTVVAGQHDIIERNCQGTNCYEHESVGYDYARKIMFGELFVKKDDKGKYVEDVYCGKKFYFRSVDEVPNMHSQVNIEHTWPQSKFNKYYDKSMQKSDMHHLYPTDSMANNRRGNNEFGDLGNRHDELNVQNCSASRMGEISGHFIFTPPKEHRGNVARSLFYFAVRYNVIIGKAEELILRQWHNADPVDEAEKTRHEMIARYQNVRNPFVDYPQLVDKVIDF
jgi:deoxyribonuclease I